MSSVEGNTRASRKDDHVRLALQQQETAQSHNEFDDVEFVHHAFAAIDQRDVSLETSVGEWRWASPFYINGMTGGTQKTGELNRALATAARELNVAVASGSVSVALDNPTDKHIVESFTCLRTENPDGFVMANIGIDRGADDAVRAVDLLQANALQVHVNAVQEIAMPEGSRTFSHWLRSLETLVAASPVPVIVKEVGFGLSRRSLEQIAQAGAQIADVGGKGGTDFLAIENARHESQRSQLRMLTGFGQSAMACLLDAPQNDLALLASGGVRNPFDVVKALAAGAQAVGVAGVFLRVAEERGASGLIDLMVQWRSQLISILSLLGARSPADLGETDVIIRGSLAEYCERCGVDLSAYARRTTT